MNKTLFIASTLFLFLSTTIQSANNTNNHQPQTFAKELLEDEMLGPFFKKLQEEQKQFNTKAISAATSGPAFYHLPAFQNSEKKSKLNTNVLGAPLAADAGPKEQKKTTSSLQQKQGYYCTHKECKRTHHDWMCQSKLNRHQRTHTEEKTFQCTICQSCYNQKSSAITHILAKSHQNTFKKKIRSTLKLHKNADVSKRFLNRTFAAQFIIDKRKKE